MSLPSVSWPRLVDSSIRKRTPVAIIWGHLTLVHDSGPIKCILTIFTTMFHQASSCREEREAATHKCRAVTTTHLISSCAACNIKSSHFQGFLSAKKSNVKEHINISRWHLPLKGAAHVMWSLMQQSCAHFSP